MRQKLLSKTISNPKRKNNKLIVITTLSGFLPYDKHRGHPPQKRPCEWRIFVYNGEIQNSMYYLGDMPTAYPDKISIENMVNAIANDTNLSKLNAYTIDVGVFLDENNQYVTTPIEVHPFVDCGLYGFCDKVILDMLEEGYNWYRYYADSNIQLA